MDIKYEIYADIDYELVGDEESNEESLVLPRNFTNKRLGVYYDSVYHDQENGTEKINSARSKAYLDRSRILFDRVRKHTRVIAGERQDTEETEYYMNVKARGIVAWNDSMNKNSYVKENIKGVRVTAKES